MTKKTLRTALIAESAVDAHLMPNGQTRTQEEGKR
jgi:hypothetical protein